MLGGASSREGCLYTSLPVRLPQPCVHEFFSLVTVDQADLFLTKKLNPKNELLNGFSSCSLGLEWHGIHKLAELISDDQKDLTPIHRWGRPEGKIHTQLLCWLTCYSSGTVLNILLVILACKHVWQLWTSTICALVRPGSSNLRVSALAGQVLR